jgi:hypothetical protein
MATNPLLITDINNVGKVEPGISSRVDVDSAAQQRFIAFRDVILFSPFEGGEPAVITPFVTLQELRQTHDPENIRIRGVDLTNYMKAPSFDANVRGAYRIYTGRIGQPTQATVTLLDSGAADVLLLTSRDWGTYVNKTSIEIGPGSLVGRKALLRFATAELLTLDNLRTLLHVAYTGNGSAATMTISMTGDIADALTTAVVGATDGSVGLDIDLTHPDYSTLQALIAFINAQNGYRASLHRFADPVWSPQQLDAVTAVSLRIVPAFTIQYTGAGSDATMTVTDTALTTSVTGAPGDNLNLSLTAAATDRLGELVSVLNAYAAYTCVIGNNADITTVVTTRLANVSTVDIRTAPYVLNGKAGALDYLTHAELGVFILAINGRSRRIMASRVSGAVTPPANVAQTFLSGGTNPSSSLSDWLEALEALDVEDLTGGFLFPNTTDTTVQAAILSWIEEQRINKGKAFKAFFGAAPGLTSEEYKAIAAGFNSTNAVMTVQRGLAPDGVTQLPPLYGAAIACGMAAGVPNGQTTTNVTVRYRSLVDKYSLPQREDLMGNGIYVFKEEKGRGIVTAFALTTSLSPDRIDRVLSESMARDLIDQNIRADLITFLGAWGTKNLIPQVKGRVIDSLTRLENAGVITSGLDERARILPAFTPPDVALQAGLLTVTWQALIGGEISHIDVLGVIGYQTFALQLPVAT